MLSSPGFRQPDALLAALDKVTGSLSPSLAEMMQGTAQILPRGG